MVVVVVVVVVVDDDDGHFAHERCLRILTLRLEHTLQEIQRLQKLTNITLSGNPLNEIEADDEDTVMSAGSFISSVFGNIQRIRMSGPSRGSITGRPSQAHDGRSVDRAVQIERAILAGIVASSTALGHNSASVTFEPFSEEELVQMQREEKSAVSPTPSHKAELAARRDTRDLTLRSYTPIAIVSALASHLVQTEPREVGHYNHHHHDDDGDSASDSASTATPITSDDEGEGDAAFEDSGSTLTLNLNPNPCPDPSPP